MLLLSCSGKQKAQIDLFADIKVEDYISDSLHETCISTENNIKIPVGKFDPEGHCRLHELFDTVIGVKLETSDASLIGAIDKIVTDDECMYILDKYKTRSVKRFSLQGKYLNTIGRCGEGPDMQREPTDFCLGENEILILDQFQSKIFTYTKEGTLKSINRLPFTCVQFHQFDKNNYVFLGIDADNYHLPEIINYALWQTDSCFVINNKFVYREKDKYQSFLERNSLASYMGTLYYKKALEDTIFSITPQGEIHSDYIIDLGSKAIPPKLFEKENRARLSKEFGESNYVPVGAYFICRNNLYATCTLKKLNYNLFYNIPEKKIIMAPGMINDINLILPFSRPIGATSQSLICATEASRIYDVFHSYTEEQWLETTTIGKKKAVKPGRNIVDFCKDIKMDDNPIVSFFVFKE